MLIKFLKDFPYSNNGVDVVNAKKDDVKESPKQISEQMIKTLLEKKVIEKVSEKEAKKTAGLTNTDDEFEDVVVEIDDMKTEELKIVAEANNIEGFANMKKAQLFELLCDIDENALINPITKKVKVKK